MRASPHRAEWPRGARPLSRAKVTLARARIRRFEFAPPLRAIEEVEVTQEVREEVRVAQRQQQTVRDSGW